eukprot:TRINITY_DN2348_c0_g1_i4.p1 TRINITY_DN2348_c0_g1~~TRINITY_DN2348_c0_g1_i4.p1  ORF type:complete len:206 (-),score=40.64 TRINITY_DN2348_c0_g1_i4:278-895(-)
MSSISVEGNIGGVTTCSDDEEYIVVGGIEEEEFEEDLDKGLFLSGAVVLTGQELDEGFGPSFREGKEFARKVPIYDKTWAFEFTKSASKDQEMSKKLEADNQILLEERVFQEMQALEQQLSYSGAENQTCCDEDEIVRVNESALQSCNNGNQTNDGKKGKKSPIKFKNVIPTFPLQEQWAKEAQEAQRKQKSGKNSNQESNCLHK